MNSPSWRNSEFADLSQKSAIISEKTSGKSHSSFHIHRRESVKFLKMSVDGFCIRFEAIATSSHRAYNDPIFWEV